MPARLTEYRNREVQVANIPGELSLEIATPAEARDMLQTKGGHNVSF
jgi:hypothetical protein